MRILPRLLLPAAVAATLLGASSCRTMGGDPAAEGTAASTVAYLRVENENFSDVDIHIVRSGLPTRIGRVMAGHVQQFTLTPALLGPSDVVFLATVAGSNARASSGSLIVSAGQTVNFRVASTLSQSSATIR
jgi:hypothetical protein